MRRLRAGGRAALAAAAVVAGAACAAPSARDAAIVSHWRDVVERDPMAEAENIRVTPVGRSAWASYHIVRVRDREALHVHARHDLAVAVLDGEGEIRIGVEDLPCRPGTFLSIPRGTPHAFRNLGAEPAVAYVVFTPPFDGKDVVPVRP